GVFYNHPQHGYLLLPNWENAYTRLQEKPWVNLREYEAWRDGLAPYEALPLTDNSDPQLPLNAKLTIKAKPIDTWNIFSALYALVTAHRGANTPIVWQIEIYDQTMSNHITLQTPDLRNTLLNLDYLHSSNNRPLTRTERAVIALLGELAPHLVSRPG